MIEHSYYGRLDDTKPKEGVYLQMLDKHIEDLLDKILSFEKKLSESFSDFKMCVKNELKKIEAVAKENVRKSKVLHETSQVKD